MWYLADAHDGLVPVGCTLLVDETVGEPLLPLPGSAYELVPHASSGALVCTTATSAERCGSRHLA